MLDDLRPRCTPSGVGVGGSMVGVGAGTSVSGTLAGLGVGGIGVGRRVVGMGGRVVFSEEEALDFSRRGT